jgi:hypothetical protein
MNYLSLKIQEEKQNNPKTASQANKESPPSVRTKRNPRNPTFRDIGRDIGRRLRVK